MSGDGRTVDAFKGGKRNEGKPILLSLSLCVILGPADFILDTRLPTDEREGSEEGECDAKKPATTKARKEEDINEAPLSTEDRHI